MSSVADLNRQELLKRAKELEDLLDASKPKICAVSSLPVPTHPIKRSVFPRSQFALSRTQKSQRFTAHNEQKSANAPRNVVRAPLSHNRVFVRNKNRETQADSAVSEKPKTNESDNVNRTGSAALVAVNPLGSRGNETSLTATNVVADASSSLKPTLSVREPPNEARNTRSWKHDNLVLTIGGDASSEDDEVIRNHHAALRNILHPVKPMISRSTQRKSVVYQSATKLVKIHSASVSKTLGREKLKPQAQHRDSSSTQSNHVVLKKRSSSVGTPNPLNASRMEAPASQTTAAADVDGSGRKEKESNPPSESSKAVTSTGVLKLASSKGAEADRGGPNRSWRSQVKTGSQPDVSKNFGGISSSGTSLKPVLKRTRFKLLKGVTMSKRNTGPINKVSKKRTTLKTNSKHLRTLLMLRGVPFQSSKDGKALKRINTSLTSKRTPTRTTMKTRFTAVGSFMTKVASQLVNRSVFKLNKKKKSGTSTSVSSPSVKHVEPKKDCIFFIRFGKCHKGNSCKFQHDPKKVSICTKFLRGTCKAEKCPFIHNVDKDRMPLCSYFQRGQCNATNCPYRHSYFRGDVPLCQDFLRGFCEKGQMCPKQHVLVCANVECSRDPKTCPLFHKKKTKLSGGGKEANTRQRKRKTLVIRQKDPLKRGEAWPEFVTLSGSDDEVADVQMEMPNRTSENIKRFLQRRTRPTWPDYSKGISADPVDLRNMMRVNGQLRQTMRKARWLRKVRPIKIVGEFIPLDYVAEAEAIEQAIDPATVKRRRRQRHRRKSRARKSSICYSAPSEQSSGDESLGSVRAQKERVFETDDDEDFDPAYRTYGEALRKAKRCRTSFGSADSISSYTSPADSSDESIIEDDSRTSSRYVPQNTHAAAAAAELAMSNASKRAIANDDDEWLLDYLCPCDQPVSPLPEPERLDFFGPVYEHWEFRSGDRIREAIEKFRGSVGPEASRAVMPVSSSGNDKVKTGSVDMDFIPLRDHEEGEILTESEDGELLVSGDDLAVVDMELASDDDAVMSPEPGEEQSSFEDADEKILWDNPEKSLPLVDDVSDLEEGEVL